MPLSADSSLQLATAENCEFVRGLFAVRIARGELDLPLLPEVAMRIVQLATAAEVDAAEIARLIGRDQALATHVLRVAGSAAHRPEQPIESLQQAITWLGLAEVADIALTVAAQGKLLSVPRQRSRVQRLWRHALAVAFWSRAVALAVGRAAEASYLCGLLHEIGRPICLQQVAELSQRAGARLTAEEFEQLGVEFAVPVGERLAQQWRLPEACVATIRWWQQWADAPAHRDQAAIVFLGHQLADHMFANSMSLAADALAVDPVASMLGLGLPELLQLVVGSDRIQALVASH
jgi:HD-like signal output (HDOD) protein